uniref:Uncharacterized protein n=1 Tax=Arundo donax TaxID=35708 RepID=A0A0A9BT50_ARUDO
MEDSAETFEQASVIPGSANLTSNQSKPGNLPRKPTPSGHSRLPN